MKTVKKISYLYNASLLHSVIQNPINNHPHMFILDYRVIMDRESQFNMLAKKLSRRPDPCSMVRASAMLLRHIGYPDRAEKVEMALEVCGQFEKKMSITGRDTGVTGEEYSNYLLDTIQDDQLETKWKSYQ